MIIGIGIDLAETARIARSLERFGRRFENRVFTDAECRYCHGAASASHSFAARFAAKEAFFKALGVGLSQGVSWTEVGVEKGPGGKPVLVITGQAAALAAAAGADSIHLSLTHTATSAAAVVVLEKRT